MVARDIPEQPKTDSSTSQQWQAMYQSGNHLLVSASAGSGKTYVLIQRIIQKVLRGVNVDELLIVTFTESAAREMNERLEEALRKKINESKNAEEQAYLTQQLQRLPQANISTMHAFCMKVIRRYYYMIDLDPVFSMLTEQTEIDLLKERVWDELRETLYENEDGTVNRAFYHLTKNFSSDRDDKGLQELIFQLTDYARSHPTPVSFIQNLSKSYQVKENGDLSDNKIFIRLIRQTLKIELETYQKKAERMQAIAVTIEGKVAREQANEMTHLIQSLQRALEQNFFGFPVENFQTFSRAVSKNTKIYKNDPEKFQEFNQLKEEIKTFFIKDIKEKYFSYPTKKMLDVLEKSRQTVAYLSEVCLLFLEKFQKEKLSINKLDFSDLEHFTLQILTQNKEGQLSPSEASNYYRSFFQEVLMDEYQDTNAIQETIAKFVATDTNRFMVGDVKQSIYRFRQADPTLFIDKYETYSEMESILGTRILLKENFRSRKEVLNFTNYIFNALMNKALGEIDYDYAAQLVCGNLRFPEDALMRLSMQPEILIFETGTAESPEGVDESTEMLDIEDKSHGEILMTGLKIRELVDKGFQIYDKSTEKNRKVCFGDIVLLTPTRGQNEKIVNVFETLDIPVVLNDVQSFFKATEIMTMMSLLTIIDNPYQDIPLASVLRSFIVGCDENDLVRIRLNGQKGSFFEAMKATTDIPKITNFKKQLQNWRNIARTISIHDLIEKIYEETAFCDYVYGLPNGVRKQANLYALSSRAKSFDDSNFKGLFQFIKFIEKMRERDNDLAEPIIDTSNNQVRVMTIHASKGLEFPIVFLMNMNKQWNTQDRKGKFVLDDKFGIGIQYVEDNFDEKNTQAMRARTPFKYTNFILEAIKNELLKKSLSEEMRKLYVALTRAEQKLFLVGSYKDKATCFADWTKEKNPPQKVLSFSARSKAKSMMEWVGMAISSHPDFLSQLEKTTTLFSAENFGTNFKITFENEQTLTIPEKGTKEKEFLEETENEILPKEILEQAKELLEFKYPFPQATQTTKHQSVSEIKQVFVDPDDLHFTPVKIQENGQFQSNRLLADELTRPKFLEKNNLDISPAVIGTATHSVLSQLDFTAIKEESVQEKIEELVKNGTIEESVAERINQKNLTAFLASDFGQFLQKNAPFLKVEQPFSMLIHPSEIFVNYPQDVQDDVLIHGIIDGFVEIDEGILLFDYKTDFIPLPDLEAKAKQRYAGQLYLYKQALEIATKKKVTRIVLVMLSCNQTIEITVS